GIRYPLVTGVQTCALPIFAHAALRGIVSALPLTRRMLSVARRIYQAEPPRHQIGARLILDLKLLLTHHRTAHNDEHRTWRTADHTNLDKKVRNITTLTSARFRRRCSRLPLLTQQMDRLEDGHAVWTHRCSTRHESRTSCEKSGCRNRQRLRRQRRSTLGIADLSRGHPSRWAADSQRDSQGSEPRCARV